MQLRLFLLYLLFGRICMSATPGDIQYPIEFTPKQLDCGIIYDTSKFVRLGVKYTNVSKDVISISKVSVSCGCTSLVFDKPKLSPGETGTINLEINPFGKTDVFVVTVIPVGASTDHPLGILKVGGRISQIAKISPSLVICRASAGNDLISPALQSSIILDKSLNQWKLESAEFDNSNLALANPSFSYDYSSDQIIKINVTFAVRLKTKGLALPDRASIRYRFTNKAPNGNDIFPFNIDQDVLILPANAVSCFPTSISFMIMGGEKSLEQSVFITNSHQDKISFSSSIKECHLLVEGSDKETERLKVSIDPVQISQSMSGKITLTDNFGKILTSIPITINKVNLFN